MVKIKNAFVACKRLAQGGKVYKDGDGAFYLVDHDHPALAGKEFANGNQVAQAITEYNEKNPNDLFEGEYILLNVVDHS